MNTKNYVLMTIISFLCLAFGASAISAQTNEFTYQGRLTDGGLAATGNYDLQFELFDAASSGNQKGSTVTLTSIPVSNGIFTVKLDFGDQFDGNTRFLQVAVKSAGNPNQYTSLNPRQVISSTPYAVRSKNAASADNAMTANTAGNSTQLGGINADQYVLTTDPRLNGTPGNYVQNTTVQQAASNFAISGTGRANIINADTRYDLGGDAILHISGGLGYPRSNTFLGVNAGNLVTPGDSGSLGNLNSFFGSFAGESVTGGSANSFFGSNAGKATNASSGNSFFGANAGILNTGSANTFIGHYAGNTNGSGYGNVFLGQATGYGNTTGGSNTFLGKEAGYLNVTGSNNTVVGDNADFGSGDLRFATAIGAESVVKTNNTIALGRSNGADKVVVYGLGSGGTTQLCRNPSNQISTCSSSLRYKSNINPFFSGLNMVKQLRPITFDWKEGGMHDLGLGAEDVAKVNELLVIRNENGEVEGVKYDRIGIVLINAVKEQQEQIARLQQHVEALRNRPYSSRKHNRRHRPRN